MIEKENHSSMNPWDFLFACPVAAPVDYEGIMAVWPAGRGMRESRDPEPLPNFVCQRLFKIEVMCTLLVIVRLTCLCYYSSRLLKFDERRGEQENFPTLCV